MSNTTIFSSAMTAVVAHDDDFPPDMTWAQIHGGSGNLSSTSSTNILKYRCYTSNNWYELNRGIITFDTSSLIDDCDIVSAKYKFYVTLGGKSDGGFNVSHLGVQLTLSNPTYNTSIINADYQNVGDTKIASEFLWSSVVDNSWNEIFLNATGLSNIIKTGYTKVGMRFISDVDNIDPTIISGVANILIYYSGTLSPKLEIVWQYPDAGGFRYRRSGSTYKCGSTITDPGGSRIKFRKGGTNYYLPLVLPSDPSASYFRVRYGGITMAGIHID